MARDTSAAAEKKSGARASLRGDGRAFVQMPRLRSRVHAERRQSPARPAPQALFASMPALGSRRGGTSRREVRRPDARDTLLWIKGDLDPPSAPGSGGRASYAKLSDVGHERKAADPRGGLERHSRTTFPRRRIGATGLADSKAAPRRLEQRTDPRRTGLRLTRPSVDAGPRGAAATSGQILTRFEISRSAW
jgi:hypothetical protein